MLGLPGETWICGLDGDDFNTSLKQAGAKCMFMPAKNNRVDLKVLMAELAQNDFNEIQVEAGATLCGELLQQGLIDELLIYQAPILLGGGAVSPFVSPRLDNMDDRVHLESPHPQRVVDRRARAGVDVPGLRGRVLPGADGAQVERRLGGGGMVPSAGELRDPEAGAE